MDRLYHIGTVVKDRTAAQQAFSRILGYGNWVEMELHTDQGMSVSLRGQPVDHHARITFARHNNLSCELMEPGAGKGLYHEFLADIGEGMQHFPGTLLFSHHLQAGNLRHRPAGPQSGRLRPGPRR